MIDEQTILQIKERIDIVEVVSDFINLKKSGSSYKALSTFSSEKTPSFFVSPAKQIFKCFSTGKGGDAIEFLMTKGFDAKLGARPLQRVIDDEIKKPLSKMILFGENPKFQGCTNPFFPEMGF